MKTNLNNLDFYVVNNFFSKKIICLVLDKDLNWVENNLDYIPTNSEIKKAKLISNNLNNNEFDHTFILNYKYFYNLKLFIKKGVFVPQFDTEELVNLSLKQKLPKNAKILEIGFGSGAISLALAKNTEFKIDAFDISRKAYNLAKKNASLNKIYSVNWFKKNAFKNNFSSQYDLIISNPPYIEKNDPFIENWVLKNQPKKALYSKKGTFHFEQILFLSKTILKSQGIILLEIGWRQEKDLLALIDTNIFKFEFIKDLSNKSRFLLLLKK